MGLMAAGWPLSSLRRCNRFEPLSAYDGMKHTCIKALAAHNARRRDRRRRPGEAAADSSGTAEAAGAAAAGSGAAEISAWLGAHAQSATTAPVASAAAAAVLLVCANPFARVDLAAAAAAAAAGAALHGCTVTIKMPADALTPDALPSAALRATVDAHLFPYAAGLPTGAIRVGCVLLSLDALVPAKQQQAVPAQQAAAAAAAVLSLALGEAGRGGWVRVEGQQAALDGTQRVTPAVAALALRLTPSAALLSGGSDVFTLRLADAAEPGCTAHARQSGHALECRLDASGAIVLHARAGAEGAALVELERGGVSSAVSLSRPRAVLLCADAAIVAQVCSTCDGAHASQGGTDEALQHILRVVGDALRPHAPRRVRCAAAAAAVWLGWDALLARLLLTQPPDGALLLCCAAHAAARRTLTQTEDAACAAAIAAAASQLWPPAACRRAAALLHEASTVDAHLRPECAAAAALDACHGSDDGASLVLHALVQLLEAAPEEDDDEAEEEEAEEGAGPAHESGDASYLAWLARHNARHWRVVSTLALLGNVMQLLNAARYVLFSAHDDASGAAAAADGSFGSFNTAAILEVRLHPIGGGEAFSLLAVPWTVAASFIRLYAVLALALRLPAQVALVVASRRLARDSRRYESLFLALLLIDTAFYAFIDALVVHATRAAPEWPALPAVVHAAGVAIGLPGGPFRLRATFLFLALKCAATCGALAYAGAWRVLARNPGCAAQLAALATGALLARRRDRALREAHRAATRSAQKLKLQ
jgi:hypothetical protein